MIGVFDKAMLEEKLHSATRKAPIDVVALHTQWKKSMDVAILRGTLATAFSAETRLQEGLRRLEVAGVLELQATLHNLPSVRL